MSGQFPEMYCDVNLEYPGSHIALGGFGVGCSYDYVSSTFLEGFVNHTKIIEARLLDRYRTTEENTEKLANFLSCIELPFGKGRRYHTSLYECFNDDVLMLCRNDDGDSKTWWFYWFDRDCSDSSIACFRTDDTEEQIIKNFQEFVDGLDYANRVVPPGGFVGWITS